MDLHHLLLAGLPGALRYTPGSGHAATTALCPFRANNGSRQFSITSFAWGEQFARHRAFEFEFAQVLEVMNHFVHQDRLLCGSRSGPGIRKKDRFRGTLIQGDDLALVCRLNWLVDPGFARPIW